MQPQQNTYSIINRLLLICLAVLMAQPLFAQEDSGGSASSVIPEQLYNDWRLSCGGSGLRDEQCYIMQTIGIEATQQRLLAVVAGNLGVESKPILHFTLPLGIYLPAGMVFNIDGGNEYRAEVNTCVADGCKAVLEIDSTLRDLLNVGKQMKVAFLDAGTRQQILVEVSLHGFASAFAAL